MSTTLDTTEALSLWLGAAGTAAMLVIILWGLGHSLTRPRGRAVGRANQMLRLPAYILISIGYFGLWYLLWKPIPIDLSPAARIVALFFGSALLFPGLGLSLWGRLVLGKMYNVSSALGAQLYTDQQLITYGPYALVRNPMYVGIIAATLGGLLIYRTWSMVFALTFFGLVIRARRDEQALAAEFGLQWADYCDRVPGWIPIRVISVIRGSITLA
jgi:protein-S-isoprenylcysteine O-methyltransferase Ste14